MAVWALAFVMTRPSGDGNSVAKPYLKVLLTETPDEVQRVVDHERDVLFPQTDYAKEGWTLVGDPALFDFHHGLFEGWKHLMSPAPEPVPDGRSRDHLQVVK
tara:strand:+ start:2863 stop:3168 length:306 start_codon:yes stop_codon:yes gene_type:complete